MGAKQTDNDDDARSRPLCGFCPADTEETQLLLSGADDVALQHQHPTVALASASVVQFACAIFFCRENEGRAQLEVVRFGDASGVCSVHYHTVESSAKEGTKYVAQSGTVQFAAGETTQPIDIELVDNDSWDATLEFGVLLTNSRGAQLGMYLNSCRVKIIDEDCFPTNVYKDFYASDRVEDGEEVPAFGIFGEYCKMNMLLPEVYWGTFKTLCLDQVKNLYFFLTLYLQMYLVDVVLSREPEGGEEGEGGGAGEGMVEERRLLYRCIGTAAQALASSARMLAEATAGGEEEEEFSLVPEVLLVPGDRTTTAIVVGVIYIAPFILLHIIDVNKLSFNVAGASRLHLQTNLMRKFLNYKEEHRARISVGDVTMTMVRDVTEVVNFGFMKVFEIFRICGKLMLALVFILTENRMAVVPLLVYPAVMAIFLCCRSKITLETSEKMAQKQNDVVATASEAVRNYRLIADFALRPLMVDTYESKVNGYNESEVDTAMVGTHNMYLPPWLTTILVGGFMMTAPFQVVTFGGPLSLGAFLATINIFKEVGVELAEIYKEFMEIQKSVGPLRKVSYFMNLETDLLNRMSINRMRRAKGNELRIAARSDMAARKSNVISTVQTNTSQVAIAKTDQGEDVFAVDLVEISVSNLSYYFDDRPVLKQVNVSFQQGKLYAFVGPPHQGKSTLLRLLGQVLLVDEETHGNIFVPPHLRVLHVSQETFFLSTTLLKNIVFNSDMKKIGGLDRIRKVCELVRFPPYMMAHLELVEEPSDMEERAKVFRSWMSMLSYTDFARINLARAFVMNPECMILHKPSLAFDDDEAPQIIKLLRQHVDEKGLAIEGGWSSRRRRTVFFTTASVAAMENADMIYEVSTKKGAVAVSKDEALENLHGATSAKQQQHGSGHK